MSRQKQTVLGRRPLRPQFARARGESVASWHTTPSRERTCRLLHAERTSPIGRRVARPRDCGWTASRTHPGSHITDQPRPRRMHSPGRV